MKVRLYRGPHDGKVLMVNDHENNIIFKEAPVIDWSAKQPSQPVGLETIGYHRTGHSHPDGSVYFEWDKPRGTRMNRKRKPKAKAVQPNGFYVGTPAYNTSSFTITTSPYNLTSP